MNKSNQSYNTCTIRKIFFVLDQCTRNYSVVDNGPDAVVVLGMLSADVNNDSRPDIIHSFLSTDPSGVAPNFGMVNILFNNGDDTLLRKLSLRVIYSTLSR